ncbi:hypothetical protein [Tranquillimonas rosea]|uniref:hypothetical protein n=1 Tax=Tranquillimonas rosea TaxID=641238 RepID=UPI003BA91A1F
MGVPIAGGGVRAGPRDLGRPGLLVLNEGEVNGFCLFPAAVTTRRSPTSRCRGDGGGSAFWRGYHAPAVPVVPRSHEGVAQDDTGPAAPLRAAPDLRPDQGRDGAVPKAETHII